MANRHRKFIMDIPRVATVGTGLVTILTAVFGLYLSFKTLITVIAGGFAERLQQYDVPYFYPASYLMLSVTILCCVVLEWCGTDQVRLKLAHLKLFVGLFVFELLYLVFVGGVLWRSREFGMSVGAATGAAMNGLLPPFFVLLPLWAPFTLAWAKKKLTPSIAGENRDAASGAGSHLEN